ncbi:DNA circularization protein [Psychrobacter sp. AT9]|uniref:DNA circularization protein n=1 Tax=Psychrobacter sp. AT9 TaxID=3242893 RepID=UPI0039A52F5A
MAWQDTLYDASFRGVPFEYFGVDDSQDKTLATHQAPYANDADIHDMGNNPKNISMTAIIDGGDYEQALENLLTALDAKGLGELVHPVFGAITAICTSYRVKHDSEIVDGCTVEMQFVQAKPKRTIQHFMPEPMPAADQMADSVILATSAEELTVYQEQLIAIGSDAAAKQARTIPETVRSKLREVRTTLGTNLVRVDDLLSPPVWLGSIVNDVDGIVKMLPLDYDPMSNWRRLFNRIKAIGAVFDDSDVPPLRRTGQVLPAAMISRGVITILQGEQKKPMLTPDDLIAINDEARLQIQDAIDQVRADNNVQNDQNLPVINTDVTPIIRDLKRAAAQLQTLTDATINSRPPLIKYTVTVPCTWRLLAHLLYGDYTRANELARLNRGLVDASVIEAGTQVARYAR